MADRKILTGITADAFVSDADKWALEKLKKVPLLPIVIRKFYDVGFDRWFYCMNMSMSVRCGPNQFPSLYEKFQHCCKIMDMPEPELYLTNNPIPNAWAGGIERPFITLRSGIVENLSDEQLYYLIGHELGHVKAEHVLYFNVGAVLLQLLDYLGRRTFGAMDLASTALVVAFYEWIRQAEYSADRAGLLASQSIGDCLDSLVAMSAGKTRFSEEMSREAFLDQARSYQNADALDQLGKAMLFSFFGWKYTHPFPVARAQELDRWVQSGAFDKIMAGDYPKVEAEGAA